MAGGNISGAGCGGSISPAARTSSINGINLPVNLVLRKISRQANLTSLSGYAGCLAAISNAFGTTESNLMISAMS